MGNLFVTFLVELSSVCQQCAICDVVPKQNRLSHACFPTPKVITIFMD